jgi:hypothetical protein
MSWKTDAKNTPEQRERLAAQATERRYAHMARERAPLPDWMLFPELLPKKPPTRKLPPK